MLGEAGLMLADDDVVPRRAGCYPRNRARHRALDRFERAKLRFSVP